jgi:capsular polysaccharide biosynthesis protein
MATKTKFTFRNYIKELKKSWFVLVLFLIIGGLVGTWHAFKTPTQFEATSKIFVHNSMVDNGTATSPYAQIGELLLSESIIASTDENLNESDLSEYTIVEKPYGVFTITATSTDYDKAIKTANTIVEKASNAIASVYDDAKDYHVTILKRATNADSSTTTRRRAVSAAIIALGAVVLAMIIIFIKFDYCSDK